jgi:hypothetical protein
MNLILSNIKNNKWNIIILSVVIIAGFLIRIKGLGRWPLAHDEFLFIRSVENILSNGLPEFEGGGLYLRGILQQYFTALLLLIGVKGETAGRIIPVIANLLTIPPLYMLAKRFSNKAVALSVVFLFLFSTWEIEMARFARMYAPFQAVFIWYIYFLTRYLFDNKEKFIWYAAILSVISFLTHEGGIFILLFNFIFLFWQTDQRKFSLRFDFGNKRTLLLTLSFIIIFVSGYLFLRNDSKLDPVNLYSPPVLEYLNTKYGETIEPFFLVSNLSLVWIIPLFLIIIPGIYFFYKILTAKQFSAEAKFSLILILFFSYLNQFGLALIIFLCFSLMGWIKVNTGNINNIRIFWVIIILVFSFWILYLISGSSIKPENLEAGLPGKIKFYLLQLFNYPDLYRLTWMFIGIFTKFIILSAIILTAGFVFEFIKDESFNIEKFLLLTIIIFSVGTTFFTIRATSRYLLMLYPLLLFLIIQIPYKITTYYLPEKKNLIKYFPAFITAFIIFISEDFNYYHLKNIDQPDINFRTIYQYPLNEHYYRREDCRTPAEYINKNATEADIIIANQSYFDYYLDRLDYMYVNYREGKFATASIFKGTKERWTNADLIWNENDLADKINNSKTTVWLMARDYVFVNFPYYKQLQKYIVFEGIDKTVQVYKIPPYQNIEFNN